MENGTYLLNIEQIIGINDRKNFKELASLQLTEIAQRLHKLNRSSLIPKDYLILTQTNSVINIAIEVIERLSDTSKQVASSGPAGCQIILKSNIPSN